MNNIKNEIELIGKRLVTCDYGCLGISCKQSKGIVPRCLVYESKNSSHGLGCVIVGINPGISNENERQVYLTQKKDQGNLYESVLNYWDKSISTKPYYVRLRNFVRDIDLMGPILWTELVKCENKNKGDSPPLQTFRNCIDKYLNEELKYIPLEWPIIAVGDKSFKAVSYMYRNRNIIGVPHPTAARGHFANLKKYGKVKKGLQIKLYNFIKKNKGHSVWLFEKS